MRRLLMPFSILLVVWSIQAFGALDSPTPQLLAQRLAPVISPYWTVTAVDITASVNAGDAVEPKIKQRFEATVKPSSTLYVKDQGAAKAFAPYVPIVPSVTAKSTRTLYGVAQSTYSAGQWSTKLAVENSVAGLGMPRSTFSAPTVVRGSEDEARVKEILRPDVAQRFQRQLQARIEKLKAKHEAEIRAIQTAHAKTVDQVKADNAAQVHKLNREHEQALARIKSEYHNKAKAVRQQIAGMSELIELQPKKEKKAAKLAAARKATLKHNYKQQLKALQAKYEDKMALAEQHHEADLRALDAAQQAEIERINTTHNAKVEDIKSKQQAQLVRLQTKHEANLALLEQKHKQKMASINAKYDHKVKELHEQIERTSELVALQDKKSDKQAKLAAARKTALTAREKRNHALLADYRKALASKDVDTRRAAFEAALTSDNALLRRTAIQTALKTNDSVLRKTAFRMALKSDDPVLRKTAVRIGLASDLEALQWKAVRMALNSKDPGLRATAFQAAFKSGAPRQQALALTEIVAGTAALTGFATRGAGENAKRMPIAIQITEFNAKTGKMTAKVSSANGDCNGSFAGGLAGASLALSGRECALRVVWSAPGEMTGSMRDTDQSSSYRVKISL